MIAKILIGLAAVIAAILVIAAFQPGEFRVERSIIIGTQPAAVFPHINDLHKMQVWSPWESLDPKMIHTYSGPAEGVGSKMAWAGNSQAGEGSMEVIESKPDELVRFRLDFVKPFASQSTAEYTLRPGGAGTTVTWAMYGPKAYVSKVMCMFMSMDKMIGGKFEEGLASLKKVAEAQK
jgi:hypothetical protein